jgi:hypothetical protein
MDNNKSHAFQETNSPITSALILSETRRSTHRSRRRATPPLLAPHGVHVTQQNLDPACMALCIGENWYIMYEVEERGAVMRHACLRLLAGSETGYFEFPSFLLSLLIHALSSFELAGDDYSQALQFRTISFRDFMTSFGSFTKEEGKFAGHETAV